MVIDFNTERLMSRMEKCTGHPKLFMPLLLRCAVFTFGFASIILMIYGSVLRMSLTRCRLGLHQTTVNLLILTPCCFDSLRERVDFPVSTLRHIPTLRRHTELDQHRA